MCEWVNDAGVDGVKSRVPDGNGARNPAALYQNSRTVAASLALRRWRASLLALDLSSSGAEQNGSFGGRRRNRRVAPVVGAGVAKTGVIGLSGIPELVDGNVSVSLAAVTGEIR